MVTLLAQAFSAGASTVTPASRATYKASSSSAGLATAKASIPAPRTTAARNFDSERGGFQRTPIINWLPYLGPSITELETDEPYIYVFAVQSDPRTPFPGAVIESSDDSGVCWEQIGKIAGGTVIGLVSSSSGMGAGIRGQWDTENTVEVTLYGAGELTSYTRCQVLNGRNLIQIGSEILAFTTATLVEEGIYTLSEFIRGLMDTDPVVHNTEGENFIFLNDRNRVPIRIDTGDLSVSKIYRVHSPSQDPDVDDEYEFTVEAGNMFPFQVTTLEAVRNVPSTDDWTITWCRRTRNPKPRIFSARGIVDVDGRNYLVQPLDGVGGSVVNSYVPTTESYVYTAAQQATDFGSEQSTINVQVARVNDIHSTGGKFLEKQFTG